MHKEASASSIAIIYIPGFELLQSWSSSLKYLASNLLKLISSLLFLTFMSGKIFRLQPLQKNISLVYLPWWEALCSQLEFIDICTGPKRYLFNRNWSVSYSCNLFGKWFHHYIWQCRSLLSIVGEGDKFSMFCYDAISRTIDSASSLCCSTFSVRINLAP